MDIMANSFPENLVIIGKVVSMLVAPPAHMGAILLKCLERRGVNNSVNISLNILLARAISPSFGPLISVMKMLDRL